MELCLVVVPGRTVGKIQEGALKMRIRESGQPKTVLVLYEQYTDHGQ